jgi:hypothetical protein
MSVPQSGYGRMVPNIAPLNYPTRFSREPLPEGGTRWITLIRPSGSIAAQRFSDARAHAHPAAFLTCRSLHSAVDQGAEPGNGVLDGGDAAAVGASLPQTGRVPVDVEGAGADLQRRLDVVDVVVAHR